MKTLFLKDWFQTAVLFILIFIVAFIMCSCKPQLKDSGNEPWELVVTGVLDEHTVTLTDVNNDFQYIFRVENVFSKAYERGQVIWICNY
jgi:hypothetical protein